VVFAAQLALILWLGRAPRVYSSVKEFSPSLRLAGSGTTRQLALTDPTLFALPHQEGFSGSAWLRIRRQELRPFLWSEPPRWLALNQDGLGMGFKEFMTTNKLDLLADIVQPGFELMTPTVVESNPFPTESTMRVMGGLAGRKILVSPGLPSWPSAEILSNSVVEVLVTADGKVFSASLLKPSGPGANEADVYALRESRKARFEVLNVSDPVNPLAELAWGQLVFEWHTLPLAITNSASGAVR
jgi:hypothetical protein